MKQHKQFTAAAHRAAADHLEKRAGVHLARMVEARADDLDERAKAWLKSARLLQREAHKRRSIADELSIEELM